MMGLELPADLEAFADDYDQLTSAAVYALDCEIPDLSTAWDRHYDVRPEWFDAADEKPNHIYVGAAKNVLQRLEEHRDGEIRKASLPRVADDVSLRNVWWYDDADRAFERESNVAIRLRIHLPETFVHQA